jgi:preprotein translocase subunit SecD
MNKYPVWKYVVISVALVVAFLYALPNFYATVPAVQVAGLRAVKADATTLKAVEAALKESNIEATSLQLDGEVLKVKFKDSGTQLQARDAIQKKVGSSYVVALNLMSNSPVWLSAINALPMYLGLDLQGGVHFLMQVDMKAAVDKAIDRYTGDIRTLLRDKKVFYGGIAREGERVVVRFKEKAELLRGQKEINTQ